MRSIGSIPHKGMDDKIGHCTRMQINGSIEPPIRVRIRKNKTIPLLRILKSTNLNLVGKHHTVDTLNIFLRGQWVNGRTN